MKEFHIPAGLSAACAAIAAIALGFAAPAAAQQPPTSSGFTVQGSARAAPPSATIYEDVVSGDKFTFEQRGGEAYAKFSKSGEVVALEARPAQRGDVFFFNDAGEALFRLTEQDNLISYVGDKNGVPAAVAGYSPSFVGPPMSASLNQSRVEAVAKLTKLAGHDVTIFGAQEFGKDEAWAADALSNVVIGVERANGLGGRVAHNLDSVRLVRSKAAAVSFKDGELLLGVNPDEEYNGRPSSEMISNALTQARSTG